MTLTEISKEIYGHIENYRNIRRAYKRHGIEPYRLPVLKPSKDTLVDMIVNQGMSPYEVADALGYGADGWSNIYKYCRDYGITDFDFSINAAYKNVEITQEVGAIIHGTLLGDGSLSRHGALRISHGEKQLEYLKWLHAKLSSICSTDIKKRQASGKKPYSELPTYSFLTHTIQYLKDLRESVYGGGRKRVKPLIDSKFWDAQALAIWYLDDGSLNTHSGVVTIATNSFLVEDVHLLRGYMLDKFGIKSVDEPRRNGQLAIRINKSQASHFFEVIWSAEIPKSMRYKFPSQ